MSVDSILIFRVTPCGWLGTHVAALNSSKNSTLNLIQLMFDEWCLLFCAIQSNDRLFHFLSLYACMLLLYPNHILNHHSTDHVSLLACSAIRYIVSLGWSKYSDCISIVVSEEGCRRWLYKLENSGWPLEDTLDIDPKWQWHNPLNR